MIIYFKNKNNKYKKNIEKSKKLTTISNSFDTFVIIATTSSSITLSVTSIGLIDIPISTRIASGLTITKKIIYEIVIEKYNEYKNQYRKDQQTIHFLINFIRKL